MGTTFYFEFEKNFMIWFQSLFADILTPVMSFFTMFGEQMILIVVMGFLFWAYDKEYGKFVGVNILVGTVLNPMIKNVFNRRRPYFDIEGVECLKPVEADADLYDIDAQGFSFPSGHSTSAVTVYGSFPAYEKNGKKMRDNKILMAVAIVMPLLVGISRVYLGCHYPTDVLVGWLSGALVVFVVSYLQKKIKRQWILYIALMVLGFPGLFYCQSSDYFTCYGLLIGALSGFLFEARFVKFENTKSIPKMILRVAGGGLSYLVLNVLMKLPFDKDFLDGGSFAAHMVRFGRYMIIGFVLIGIYPMAFKLFGKTEKAND